MKPRILHVCTDTNIGGAGRYVLALLGHPGFRERFEVAVACPEGRLADALCGVGIEVLLYAGANTSFSWQALRSLWRLMRRWRPRIVHTHGSLAGRVAATLVGAFVIYTKHGLAAPEEQAIQIRSPGRLLRRAAVTMLADRIVAVSGAVERSLVAAGAAPQRIRVIPGGVPVEAYTQAGPLAPGMIGALGRLSHEKGFDLLIEAMARLKGEATLLLGGDGPQHERLLRQVERLHLERTVHFMGFVEHVPDFMNRVGVFVLPSRTEGLGLVLVEAMAAGRPIVATRVGGVPEVVIDGTTGLLVEPEDPEALAAAIRRLLLNPALAEALGRSGHERVRALFDADRMAEQTAVLYEELINS